MIISRKLENKVRNRLQLILSAIELGQAQRAKDLVHELSALLGQHIESAEDEAARNARHEESS